MQHTLAKEGKNRRFRRLEYNICRLVCIFQGTRTNARDLNRFESRFGFQTSREEVDGLSRSFGLSSFFVFFSSLSLSF